MEINIEPIKKQAVSDDPELAKVLAGVGAATDDLAAVADEPQQEEMQMEPAMEDQIPEISEEAPAMDMPTDFSAMGGVPTGLDDVKINALQDLRPLIDKLDATYEEKYDIYLLLLRSSDDETLIEPAYNTARMIEDESKRANSLLEIIKEIDYLKSKK